MWCAVLVVFVLVVIYPRCHDTLPFGSLATFEFMSDHIVTSMICETWPFDELTLEWQYSYLRLSLWVYFGCKDMMVDKNKWSVYLFTSFLLSPVPFLLRLSVIKAQVVCDTRKMVSARQGLKRVKCLLLRGGPNTTMLFMVLNEVNCFNWQK